LTSRDGRSVARRRMKRRAATNPPRSHRGRLVRRQEGRER
jgi:hypothetical protein